MSLTKIFDIVKQNMNFNSIIIVNVRKIKTITLLGEGGKKKKALETKLISPGKNSNTGPQRRSPLHRS